MAPELTPTVPPSSLPVNRPVFSLQGALVGCVVYGGVCIGQLKAWVRYSELLPTGCTRSVGSSYIRHQMRLWLLLSTMTAGASTSAGDNILTEIFHILKLKLLDLKLYAL